MVDSADINGKGAVAGAYNYDGGSVGAFLRERSGEVKILRPPGADRYVVALDINIHRDVVGGFQDSQGMNHGLLRKP